MIKIAKRTSSIPSTRFAKINKNIVWLISLNIIIALSQFVVYSIISKRMGREMLGVWSLVVAATSIGQISSFGFASSLVRYLPEMLLKDQRERIGKILGTINFSNLFFTLPILLLLYFPALQYAAYLLAPPQLAIFRSIIPLSMAGLFVNNLFSVYSYLLDAMQQYYLRSIIQIGGWIWCLIWSLILMPYFGLKGVAIAYFAQSIVQFLVILAVVSRKAILIKSYPIGFDSEFFKKVFSFGIKSQYINVLVLFFDPIVKFFITRNAGLAFTANYEISNKIVLQARNLLVNTNQVIIPKIVLLKTAGTENAYFSEISSRNIFYSASVGMLVLVAAPLAVFFFANSYDHTLMQCIIIINIGWVCNMITSIHYYCSIGLDEMGDLVIYHLLLSAVVVILYLFLTNYLRWPTLYFAVPSLALFVGSIYNSYSLSKKIPGTFSWLRSVLFLYFIAASFTLLAIHIANINYAYLAAPVLFLAFTCLVFRQRRMDTLFKPY